MELGQIIREYRKQNRMSMAEFARRVGVSRAYISLLEKNQHPVTKKPIVPSIDILQKISSTMHIDFDRFLAMLNPDTEVTWATTGIATSNINTIPLYDHVSCGTGLFIDDIPDDFIAVPDRYIKPHKEYFAMTAKGDSMIGKGIIEGDILVFERCQTLESGQVGCFCIDDNCAVCKTYRNVNGMVFLESANDKYDPIVVDVLNECFKIVGKYVCRFTV